MNANESVFSRDKSVSLLLLSTVSSRELFEEISDRWRVW